MVIRSRQRLLVGGWRQQQWRTGTGLTSRACNRLHHLQGKGTRSPFDDLVASVSQISPGADGLICLLFFVGKCNPCWNMNACGVFFGLTLNQDTHRIARPLMEEVGYLFKSICDVLNELGADVEEIHCSGDSPILSCGPRLLPVCPIMTWLFLQTRKPAALEASSGCLQETALLFGSKNSPR